MKRYLWVVERKDGPVWLPTIYIDFTREAARDELRIARMRNPLEKYRVVKYTPAG